MLDEFEYRGWWWLPENPNNEVAGILNFRVNKEIRLSLFGSFHNSLQEWLTHQMNPTIILGKSDKGEKITLYNSQESKDLGMSERQISSFESKYVFIGKHYLEQHDIMFESLQVRFTYLENWLSPQAFEGVDLVNGFKFRKLEDREIEISNINSSIAILHGRSIRSGLKEATLGYQASIRINPTKSKDLVWFEEIVKDLSYFLTLVVGIPVYPKSMSSRSSSKLDEKIEIHKILSNPMILEDFHFSQMIVPYEELKDNLNEALNEWFNKTKLLNPVYELYFGTYYNTFLYPHFYFLSLLQAIEAFHRRVHGGKGEGKYLTDEDYKFVWDTLTGAIPSDLPNSIKYPEGLKSSLMKRIEYGNEYSLRTRLKFLHRIYWVELDAYIDVNISHFIDKIVKTRNYLTHRFEDSDSDFFEGDKLDLVNFILKSFLLIILLNQIGISIPNTHTMIRKHFKEPLEYAINSIFKNSET